MVHDQTRSGPVDHTRHLAKICIIVAIVVFFSPMLFAAPNAPTADATPVELARFDGDGTVFGPCVSVTYCP